MQVAILKKQLLHYFVFLACQNKKTENFASHMVVRTFVDSVSCPYIFSTEVKLSMWLLYRGMVYIVMFTLTFVVAPGIF